MLVGLYLELDLTLTPVHDLLTRAASFHLSSASALLGVVPLCSEVKQQRLRNRSPGWNSAETEL